MNITVIDNYDSFVYNLVDYMLRHPGVRVKVYRNDKVSAERVLKEKPQALVISPGPGRPREAGICIDLIRKKPPELPLLGVCLGHQAAGASYGAIIKGAKRICHGKTSLVSHDGEKVFKNIKNPFKATRYHSLVLDRKSLPGGLKVTAVSEDGEIMGIRWPEKNIYGLQFHPESILTREGLKIIRNFINISSSAAV